MSRPNPKSPRLVHQKKKRNSSPPQDLSPVPTWDVVLRTFQRVCLQAAICFPALIFFEAFDGLFLRDKETACLIPLAAALVVSWQRKPKIGLPAIAGSLYLIWGLVSLIWSENPDWTLKYLITVSIGPLMLFACSYDRRSTSRALVVGVLGAGLAALYALVQAGGFDPLAERWTTQFGQRPIGTLGNPDYLGGHLLLGMFCSLTVLTAGFSLGRAQKNILIKVAGLMMIPAFVLAAVRGSSLGLLGGLAALGIFYVFIRDRALIGRILWTKILVVVFVFVMVLSFFPEPRNRIAGLFDVQSQGARQRLITYNRTFRLTRQYPWMGVGYGNFPRHYPMIPSAGDDEPYHLTGHVHNEILRALVEGGPVAVIFFLGFAWLWILLAAIKAWKSRSGAMAVAAAAGVALGVHGLFGFPWQMAATACMAGALAGWSNFPAQAEKQGSIRNHLGKVMAIGAVAFAFLSARDLLPDAYTRQAKAQWFYGNLAGVVKNAERATVLDPGRAEMFSILGRAKLAQGFYDEAIQAYGKAAHLAPGDIRYLLPLGYSFALGEHLVEAQKILRRAIRLDSSNRDVERLLADVETRLAAP